MVRASRYIYVIAAWAVVVGLIVQVLLIGMGLLGGSPSSVDTHKGLGWIVHLTPILVIPFAFLARAGSRHWHWALASAVVVFTVPIFVIMRDSVPIAGALHPVAAFLAFPLAIIVATNSLRALNAPLGQPGMAPG